MDALQDEKYRLAGSLLEFTRIFYRLRTGRKFEHSDPLGRESHFDQISRALTRVIDGKCKRLIINVPPRYGKTELVINFVSWALAIYPDSNFLYISYGLELAMKQTATIRSIITMQQYRDLFGIDLSEETRSKANFETTRGGSVYAAGAGGTITGRGAGVRGVVDRFSGCAIIDDIHKPDEVTSDTMRQSVIDWYYNTMISRMNNADTPIIFIGQRLHENDLAGHLIESGEWEILCLEALDKAGNALYPQLHTKETLLQMEKTNPYIFAAQYQQNPQPAGGGIFKPEWFYLMEEEPKIISTFITVDAAETAKDYNDASVFSFWGIYRIEDIGGTTEEFGLHWLDCLEIRVEPKDLKDRLIEFYVNCCRHTVRPRTMVIEKKSTGVTLASTLNDLRGITVRGIERTKASGSKTERFLSMQPYIASKLLSFTKNAKHTDLCIEHMRKITANNSHRFDDICDTAYDAIKLVYIDKYIKATLSREIAATDAATAKNIMGTFLKVQKIRKQRTW